MSRWQSIRLPLYIQWRQCVSQESAQRLLASWRRSWQNTAQRMDCPCLVSISDITTNTIIHCQREWLLALDLMVSTHSASKQARAARRKAPLESAAEEVMEPKAKKPRTQKPYVPSFRSGPYGILLCLLDAKLLDGEGALTKAQIVANGQIYCDCSLVKPDPGKFYTAWNSMKTLLEKNLVYQNASRYYMTEQGTEIAKLLRRNAAGVDPNVLPLDEPEEPRPVTGILPSYPTPSSSNSMAPTSRTESRSSVSSSSGAAIPRTESHSSTSSSSRPALTSRTQSSSAPSSRSTLPVGLTSSHTPIASSSPAASKTRPSWQETDYDFDNDYDQERLSWSPTRDSTMARSRSAYLHSNTPQRAAPQPQTYSRSTYSSKSAKATTNWVDMDHDVTVLSDDSEDDVSQDTPMNKAATGSTISRQQSISYPAPTSTRSFSNIPSDDDFSGSQPPPTRSKRSWNERQPNAAPVPVSNYDAFPHLKSASTEVIGPQAADIASLARFRPYEFHPGTFDIVLILDIREVRGQSDRDHIGQKLTENGVKMEKRALDIGDVLWVARLKEPPIDGPSEIVLNYILERKRMDDLVSSIKDGRFTEQKVGARHVTSLWCLRDKAES